MASFLLQPTMAMVLLISWLAVNRVSAVSLIPRKSKTEHLDEPCPPCELLFSKLETTGTEGMLTQHVKVQERGEPKSGTGVMYFWATAALMHACDYLKQEFGEGSCLFDSLQEDKNDDEPLDRYPVDSIIFEPRLGGSDAKCSCNTIQKVTIIISFIDKHSLPVEDTCAFTHRGGIGMGKHDAGENARSQPCTFADGTHVDNYDELWRCMHETNCDITDDWTQMAIFRDPRPVVVSTFYHVKAHSTRNLGGLEGFVARELPIVCQWLAVRYIFFTGFLADQSMAFWYEDAMEDPLDWHYQWFHSIGLQLPFRVVEEAVKAAAADDLGFRHKKVDVHPGEAPRAEEGVRRFEDEVSPEILAIADDVLRTWLPPVLLERFGVLPQWTEQQQQS